VSESDSQEPAPGASGGQRPEQDSVRHRLDPDLAASAARADRVEAEAQGGAGASATEGDRGSAAATAQRPGVGRRRRAPVRQAIDTRPYRWAIGAFGLGLAIVISVVLFLSRGVGTVGVPPGHRLHNFAAPVATSRLNGNANLSKPCRLGYLGSRAVNTCLLTRHRPLVLAFFVTGSSSCVRQVDTLEKVSRQFAGGAVGFAAVAVRASRSQTARLVRSHHWTVPVAYDLDGAVGALYSVEICPLLELAYRGGVVRYRLIGNRWLQPSALAAKVRALTG
jgi:hypothetical protein